MSGVAVQFGDNINLWNLRRLRLMAYYACFCEKQLNLQVLSGNWINC